MKLKAPKFSFKNKRKNIRALFLAQTFLATAIAFYMLLVMWGFVNTQYHALNSDVVLIVLFLLSGLIGINSIYLFSEIENLIEKEKEYKMQTFEIMQMQAANNLLKSQKHEFSNNLQVLWGLLSLGKIEKAKEYLGKYSNKLNIDEKELMKLSRLPCTYLYTLLLNKAYRCQEMGVKINYYIQPFIPLEEFDAIDIVSILGNLLDNAMYEAERLGAGEGSIVVDMHCDERKCTFQVNNRGTVIPEEIRDKIFKKGFTTKGSGGSGFGLYNVKEIVKKYNGEIYVKSDEHIGTSFVVNIPKKASKKNALLKERAN